MILPLCRSICFNKNVFSSLLLRFLGYLCVENDPWFTRMGSQVKCHVIIHRRFQSKDRPVQGTGKNEWGITSISVTGRAHCQRQVAFFFYSIHTSWSNIIVNQLGPWSVDSFGWRIFLEPFSKRNFFSSRRNSQLVGIGIRIKITLVLMLPIK